MPIGVHCRAAGDGQSSEIFAVVADPESGKAVRVYHCAPPAEADAAGLGKHVAQMLIDAGAGPLLGAAGGLQ